MDIKTEKQRTETRLPSCPSFTTTFAHPRPLRYFLSAFSILFRSLASFPRSRFQLFYAIRSCAPAVPYSPAARSPRVNRPNTPDHLRLSFHAALSPKPRSARSHLTLRSFFSFSLFFVFQSRVSYLLGALLRRARRLV